jgi:hypothetical protein
MTDDDEDLAEPLNDSELAALRSTLRYYHADSLIPRLVATIDHITDVLTTP